MIQLITLCKTDMRWNFNSTCIGKIEITSVKRMYTSRKYTCTIALSESCNRCKAQAGHGERREDLVKLSVGIRAATLTDGFNIDFINKQS